MRHNCYFCKKNIQQVDYRDISLLKRYLSPWAKIKSATETKSCSKHQRQIAHAIKNARYMALMPYTTR